MTHASSQTKDRPEKMRAEHEISQQESGKREQNHQKGSYKSKKIDMKLDSIQIIKKLQNSSVTLTLLFIVNLEKFLVETVLLMMSLRNIKTTI